MEIVMTKLKAIRKQRNIRQAELARHLKVSRAAVHDAEKNGIRYVATAKKYAAILNCRPEDLLEFYDSRE